MIKNIKYQISNIKYTYQNPKILKFRLLFCILIFGFWNYCYAQPISSTELINHAKEYDGKVIVYAGEVIGDIMVRGNFVWINVNDGNNAIGIWVNKDLTKDILYRGSYRYKGDWIEISGTFQRACPEHGGDLDIHAQSIRKISPGREIKQRLNSSKRNFVFILSGILALVWILRRLKYK